MTDEAPEISKRDQFAALMDEMRQGEANGMAEAAEYFKSPEALGFRARIKGLHDQTMPGSAFDQMFGSVLKIFDSVQTTVNQVVEAQVKAEAEKPKPEAEAQPQADPFWFQ